MESKSQKTAVIAGGGVAGLSAAVFLDELGYKVTLVERQNILGGRTYSFKDKKTGIMVDNGQHLLAGAYHETISFLEKIGAKHKIKFQIPTQVSLIREDLKRSLFKLGTMPPPFHLLKAMLSFSGLGWGDKIKLWRLQREIKNKSLSLVDITVNDWLLRLGQSTKAIKNFWEILTLATLNDDPTQTTADGLACVLEKSYFAGRNDGYLVFPEVDLSALFVDPTEKYLALRKQYVVRGLSLKEIKMIDNKVQAFKFSDGTEHKADLFVSALPFRQLLTVLPETFVKSRPDIAALSQMQGSPIVSIHLFFDVPVMKDRFIGSAATRTHWFFAEPQKNTSPLQHVIGVISGAYDLLEKTKEEILSMVLQDLKIVGAIHELPLLVHALVLKEREATLSSRIGINKIRPTQKVLDNFYIVGDWTKTGLPATIESAVKSSRMMADDVCGGKIFFAPTF